MGANPCVDTLLLSEKRILCFTSIDLEELTEAKLQEATLALK